MDPDSIALVPVDYDPFEHGDYASHLLRMAHIDDQTQAAQSDAMNMMGLRRGMEQPQALWSLAEQPYATSPGQDAPTFQQGFDAAKRQQGNWDRRYGQFQEAMPFEFPRNQEFYNDQQTTMDRGRAQRLYPTADYESLKNLERKMENEQQLMDEANPIETWDPYREILGPRKQRI